MFSRLAEIIEDSEAEISEELKQAILSHLKALKVEFEKYFPNLNASDFTLVRNPFVVNIGDCMYLCEAAFSTMLAMKNKAPNRLDIQVDMHCCLSNTTPRISQLVHRKQAQAAH